MSPAPLIRMLDLGGNTVVSAATVSVRLEANDRGAVLLSSPDQMLVSTVNGVATFTALSLDKTGTGFRLIFSSANAAAESLQAISNPIAITAAPILSITVTVQPGSALRGSPLSTQPRVAVLDRFGNYAMEDSFVTAVTAELVGFGQVGTLGGQVVQNFNNGFASFTDLSVNNPAAQYVIRFSANGTYEKSYKEGDGRIVINPPIVAESESFIVMGLVKGLQVLQQPLLASGGAALLQQPRIALVDLNNQIVASATRTVRATIVPGTGSPGAVLSPIPALTAAEFGIVQFTDVSIDLAGSGYRMQFEVLGLPEPVTIVSEPFDVLVGEPSALVILTQPTDTVAAIPLEPIPVVKVVDLGGNTVSFDGPIDVQAVHGPLMEQYVITATAGSAIFTEAVNSAGTDYTLKFLLFYNGHTIQVKSNSFAVTRGVAAVLDIGVQPSHGILNQPLAQTPVVLVKDAGGNVLIDFNYPVSVSRADGPSASYPAGNLSVTPRHGEAHFRGLSITGTARSYTLRFQTTEPTLSGPRTLTATSEAFTITYDPSILKVLNPPGPRDNAQIGGTHFTFHPNVAFMDSENQVVKATAGKISLSLPEASGLSGTLVLPAVQGIVVFTDLIIDKASYPNFHSISIFSEALTTSMKVQVKPGVASSMSVFREPLDAMSGKVFFSPVVLQFLDLGGNIVTGPTAAEQVTVQLQSNKFGGHLQGTLTVSPASGVVTFNDLKVTGIGNGYTLLFVSASFRTESVTFGVHGEPVSLGLVSMPAGTVVQVGALNSGDIPPYLAPVKVALLDEAKNVITGGTWREPFASIEVDFNLQWSNNDVNGGTGSPTFDSTRSTTVVNVKDGYAVFDRLLIVTYSSGASLSGVRFKFKVNLTGIEDLISPFFSTSLGEAQLNFQKQLARSQSSGLTLKPFPTVDIRTGESNPRIVRGSFLPVTVSIKEPHGGAVLAGTTTLNASAGVYIFTDLSIARATDLGSNYILQFQVPSVYRDPIFFPDLTLLSDPFTVSVGSPASIRVHSDLTPGTSGVPFFSQPCIALRDAGENLVRDVSTVTATLIAGAQDRALLIGAHVTNATNGLASFTDLGISQLTHGAPYQISFRNGALETRSGVLLGKSGPPVNIEILTGPETSKGGAPLQPPPEIRVVDAGNTLVFGPVEITAIIENNPTGLASLSGNVALVMNGTAKFTQLAIDKSGPAYVLRFQGGSAFSLTEPFDLVVGPAARLFVDQQPGISVFGVNIVPAPRVVVLDAGNNWVTSSTVEIHARLLLPAILANSFMANTKMQGILARHAVAGVAVFDDLTIDNAGSGFRIEFSSIGLDVFVTDPFDVTGPPAIMAVELHPSWLSAGTKASGDSPFRHQPSVKIRDFGGSTVAYYDIPHGVTASVTPGSGQHMSGNPVADVIRGSAVFTDLRLHKANGAARVSFAYGGPMLTTSVLSPPIVVEAGTPRHLSILVQPSSSSRGMNLGLQPQVQIDDAFRNIVKWYTGTLSARLRLGNENKQQYLKGTPSAVFAESTGTATFTDLNVVLEQQNLYLRFQTGGVRADSQRFNIKQGPPHTMVIGNPPVGGVSTVDDGILQPQPIINVVDKGVGIVKSFSGANRCAGHDCAVTVKLICCPVNFLGDYAGPGTLSGQTEIVAVDGQAYFTDLRISAPGDYTLQFYVAAIDGISGEIFYDLTNVPVQDFTSMSILVQPGQALLGMPMRGQPRIQITSSSNARVNASYHQVNVTLTEGVGCVGLQGQTTLVASQGMVQFTDLYLTTFSGAPTCRFNFSTNDPPMFVLSEFFAMTYGPSELLLPAQPAGAQAGIVMTTQPILEFRDKGNFLLSSESGQIVSAELLQGDFDTLCGGVRCQSLLRGRTSILNSNGVATFTTLQIDRLNELGYILLFRMGKYTIYSQKFTVEPGAVHSLRILNQPSTCQITIRMPSAPAIELLDAGLNRANSSAIVTARVFPTSFTGISITGEAVQASEGVATFNNITLSGDAALGISLEFLSLGFSVVSDSFLAHRPAKTLILQNPMPAVLTAGETFLPEQKVGLRDNFDFPALADSSSTINVSLINKVTGGVTAMPDMEVASGGLASFSGLKAFIKGGQYVFRYFLTADPSTYAESNFFSVEPSTPKTIFIAQQPQKSLAAVAITPHPSVYMQDEFGNTIFSSHGYHVEVCVNDGGQCSSTAQMMGTTSLPIETEIVAFSNVAVHGTPSSRYNLLFYIELPGNGRVSKVSDMFDVRIGSPKLNVDQQPRLAKEDEIFLIQPRVSVSDGAGNQFSGSGGINYLQITASLARTSVDDAKLSNALGECPCVSRLIEGSAAFTDLKIDRAGRAFQIQFGMTDLNVEAVNTEEFHVSGSILYTEVLGLPAAIAYKTPFDMSVKLRDANGLGVAVGTLTATVLDEAGVVVQELLQGVSAVSALDGVGVFNGLSFRSTGGPYRLEFNASGFVDHSESFNVIARNGRDVVVVGLPTRVLAVTPIIPVPGLHVVDEFGVLSGFVGDLTVSVVDGTNTSLQAPMVVSASSGKGSLAALQIIQRSMEQGFRLRVQASLLGQTLEAYSERFHVDAGRLSALSCVVQPSDGITGQVLVQQPTVHAVDSGGNLLTYFSKQITIVLNDTNTDTALQGTNLLIAQEGIAVFTDLYITTPNDRYEFLVSTAESCGITSRSQKFTITYPLLHIRLTVTPPDPDGGMLMDPQPEVTFLDQRDVTVSGILRSVTISICAKPENSLAQIHGTTTLPAVKGVVHFTDVRIDLRGTYTICYTSGAFVTNQTMEVRLGRARYITMVKQPTVVNAGQSWKELIPSGTNPVFRVLDAGGNPFLSNSNQGLQVDHMRIEVLDSGIRSKPQMLMCGSCANHPSGARVAPCYDPLPFDGVFFSENTPECFIKNPGRKMIMKFSILENNAVLASVLSAPFDVATGRCKRLKVILHPKGVIAGQPFRRPPIVEMRDDGDNPIPWVRNVIKVRLEPTNAQAKLTGCREENGDTPNTNVDGTATFFGCIVNCDPESSMACLGQDLYRLRFEMSSCDGKDLTIATGNTEYYTNYFTVSREANQIRVKSGSLPTTMNAGLMPIQPRIEYWVAPCNTNANSACYVETTNTGVTVTAEIYGAPNGATLKGTTTALVVNGVAQFTDLAVNEALTPDQYNISFHSLGFKKTWELMTVTVGTVSQLLITEQPTLSAPGQPFTAKVSLADEGGNIVTSDAEKLYITMALDSSFSARTGVVLQTSAVSLTVQTTSGVASWSGLTVNKAPVIYSFTFSATKADGTYLEVKSERISVVIGGPSEVQLQVQPQDVVSGVRLSTIVAQLYDAGGNKIRTDLDLVLVTEISSGGGSLTGTTSTTISPSGVATFDNLTITYSSGASMHVLNVIFGGIRVSSNPFFVHLAPSKIILHTQPSQWGFAGKVLPEQPVMELRDAQNNRAYAATNGSTGHYVVSVALVESGATLQGNLQAIAQEGLASFTDLSISAHGSYTLSFSSGAFSTVTSPAIVISAGQLAALQIISDYEPGMNGTNAAGYSFPLQPRIQLVDSGGSIPNPVPNLNVMARISEYPEGTNTTTIKVLYGTTNATPDPVSGIAKFTNLAVNAVGRFKLEFYLGTFTVVSHPLTIVHGPIAQIVVRTQPSSAFFNEVLLHQPTIQLLDKGSNAVRGTPWVHVTLGKGRDTGSAVSGCDKAYAAENTGLVQMQGCKVTGTTSGEHSLLISTVLSGTDVLQETFEFDAETDTKLLHESAPFTVSLPPHEIRVQTPASGLIALDVFQVQPIVHAADAQSTLIPLRGAQISVSLGHKNETLLTGNKQAPLVAGIARFTDLRIDVSGSYALNFSMTHSGVTFSTRQLIVVLPNLPSKLVAQNWPTSVSSGETITLVSSTPRIIARDSAGNKILDAVDISVSADCADKGSSPCFEGTKVLNTISGVSEFGDLVLHRAGNVTLTFAHAALTLAVRLEVIAGEAVRIGILQQPPSSFLLGAAISPALKIQLEDTFGNIAPDQNYTTVAVEIYSSPVLGAILSGHTSSTLSEGVGVFHDSISVMASGVGFRLAFTSKSLKAISDAFIVNTRPSQMKFADFPSEGTGGAILVPQPRINLYDDAGAPVLLAPFTVSAQIDQRTAALMGTTSVLTSDGVAQFTNLELDRVGLHTLRFECNTGVKTITLIAPALTLIPGEPHSISVEEQPGGFATGGVPFPIQPQIFLRDAGGNLVESARPVTVSIHGASPANLGGSTALTSGDNYGAPLITYSEGALAFTDLNIDMAGVYTLTFTSPGLVSAQTTAFDVVVGPAYKVGIIEQPGDVQVGLPFGKQPIVQIQDVGGNHVQELEYTVTASINMHSVRTEILSSLELRGATIKTSVLGWCNYTKLQIDVSALFCDVIFTSPGLQSAISETFIVAAISPAASCISDINYLSDCGSAITKSQTLSIEVQPTNIVNGKAFSPQPRVRIRNNDGVVLKAYGNVYASLLSSTGAKLFNGKQELTDGIATFEGVTVDQVGTNYQIQFRYGDLVSISSPFNVTTGNASKLRFSSEVPTEWVVNGVLPTVEIHMLDHGNFLVTAQDNVCAMVSVAIHSGPSMQLVGTVAKSMSAGKVHFDDLKVSVAGVYRLRFGCGPESLLSASLDTNGIIFHSYGQPSRIEFVTEPGPAVANFDGVNPADRKIYRFNTHPKLRLIDLYGNLVHGFQGHFKAQKKSGSYSAVLLGEGDAYTLPATWGVVEFDNLRLYADDAAMQNETLRLQFGSTCCSLMSSSDLVATGPIVLNARPTQLVVRTPSTVEAGELFVANVTMKTDQEIDLYTYLGVVGLTLHDSADNSVKHVISGQLLKRGLLGVVPFSGLTISAPGTYFIRAYATRPSLYLDMVQADSAPFTVVVGPGRRLSFLNHSQGCKGGVLCTGQPSLQVQDASGNPAAVSGISVRVAVIATPSSSGSLCCTETQQNCPVHNTPCPILGGTKIATSDASGKVSFTDVSISTAGTVRLNYTAVGLGYSILEDVHVNVGPSARAKIIIPPSGFVAGAAFSTQPVVIASDFGGNWVSGAADNVSAKITLLGCAPGDLGCDSFGTMFAQNTQGISRFTDLGTRYAGQIRLEFRLKSVPTCGAVSCWSVTEVMQVAPGVPSQLAIVSATTQHFCTGNMTPSWDLEIRDVSGNRVISGGPYDLSVESTPGGEVGGRTVVQSNAGRASFSQLTMKKSCYFYSSDPFAFCYTLTFRLGEITISSSPFTVIAGPAADLAFHVQPTDTSIGSAAGYPSVRLVDKDENPVIPVPAAVPVACGIASIPSGPDNDVALRFDGVNLKTDMLSTAVSYEKTDAMSLILGQDESYVSKTSVVYNALNLNWRVPACYFPTTCPATVQDFQNFRIRVVARFGTLVADSQPLAIDVAHPANVNIYLTNFSAIVLRWNAPFFGPPPLSYRLRYRHLNSPGAQWTTLKGITASMYTFSNLDRFAMMELELCSQSLFGDRCALRGPASIIVAPVEAVTFAEVAYANEESIFLSWKAPAFGLPPPAYRITIQEFPDGWENVLLDDVKGLNISIPNLSPNKTYVFGVYSKAAGGEYYSQAGAKTDPVIPTAATTIAEITCPKNMENVQECTGTGLVLTWSKPTTALYQPRNYQVVAEQYSPSMEVVFNSTSQPVAKSDGPMQVTVTNLTRGRLTRIRLMAQSVNDERRYAPSVNFVVIPTAAPSQPVDLSFKIEDNKNIFARWDLPVDSGDGTPHGTKIRSYMIQYSASHANSWTNLNNVGKYNLTRLFTGLVMETSYDFRIAAENIFQFGQRCTIECKDLPDESIVGAYAESSFVLGQIPYWDPIHAPVKQDPPPLYNLFVGTLFTFSLKAISSGASNQLKIIAAGMNDCGASLTSVVVGNPASATFTFLPAIQHLDRTFWVCFEAREDRGGFSEKRCLRAYVVRPNPTFLAPIDPQRADPVVRASRSAVVGCLLEFEIQAHDLTSGQGITAATAAARGYNCFLKEHRTTIFSQYETKTIEGLPEHAVLHQGLVKYGNPSTRKFSWRPARGQESFDYNLCFTVEDQLGTSTTASPQFDGAFCVHVHVKRCRMCLLPGDSLFSVAQKYQTEWLNLWSGNSALLRPAEAPATSEVMLGPLYKALPHDSINSIAARMSLDPELLLSWNPDLQSVFHERTGVAIDVEQDICVLPNTCTQ
eukprot:Tamp_00012.p1 GENE.Tamp_00012~~Tamp_00012.p1  ORF type:complete len:6480 (+),score=452.85 Tamp_00012:1082-19441(+)